MVVLNCYAGREQVKSFALAVKNAFVRRDFANLVKISDQRAEPVRDFIHLRRNSARSWSPMESFDSKSVFHIFYFTPFWLDAVNQEMSVMPFVFRERVLDPLPVLRLKPVENRFFVRNFNFAPRMLEQKRFNLFAVVKSNGASGENPRDADALAASSTKKI